MHLVVVDPGVGTDRRALLVQTAKYFFVGPDNGVFSFIYEREERLVVRQITAEHYFLQPVSRTFHGRDVFSPIAAWVSKGIEPSNFGPPDRRLPPLRRAQPAGGERFSVARNHSEGG